MLASPYGMGVRGAVALVCPATRVPLVVAPPLFWKLLQLLAEVPTCSPDACFLVWHGLGMVTSPLGVWGGPASTGAQGRRSLTRPGGSWPPPRPLPAGSSLG